MVTRDLVMVMETMRAPKHRLMVMREVMVEHRVLRFSQETSQGP